MSQFLYRDEHLVIAYKPSGLLVHRGWANDRDVLMTRVRDSVGCWVYPVHRLDRGTSGVVVFALSSEIACLLGKAFECGEVRKDYVALVRGVPDPSGTIDHDIPRRPKGPRVHAVTEYKLLEAFGRYSLVSLTPRTGRLHQIRRHMKHISCPLIGDVRYGKGEHNRLFRTHYGLHRLALHASQIQFAHPITNLAIAVCSELPDDMKGAIQALRLAPPVAAERGATSVVSDDP